MILPEDHVHVPERQGVGNREDGKYRVESEDPGLSNHEHFSTIYPVDEYAGGDRHEHARQHADHVDRRYGEEASGQLPDKPVADDDVHPHDRRIAEGSEP